MTPPLEALRIECNAQIKMINQGRGTATPGFVAINRLLRACDAVFKSEGMIK